MCPLLSGSRADSLLQILGRLVVAAALLAVQPGAHAEEELPVTMVAPGVYVLPGVNRDAAPENLGRVVNTGFIVGTDGVIVIDSGANQRHGEAILSTISRTTAKPVKLLINTHPNPNFVLGNTAFAQRGIPILATTATAVAMGERCPRCIEMLTHSIGEDAMKGTEITLPQQRINKSTTLTIAGRTLALLHFGHARTEGDLAVFDTASGTLFTGELVYRGQIQHFAEARFSGWITALEQLEQQPVKILVPGRGDIGDATALATMHSYLKRLYARVGAAYRDGRSPDETLTLADVPEFFDWRGYTKNHPLNVQHAYFEHEAEEISTFGGSPIKP